MGAKGNSSPKPIRTLGELSGLVERDPGTVSRWTKRDDWPFAKKAPWSRGDVPKILRWVADTLERDTRPDRGEGDDESADDTKALRKQKLREEVRKLRANADQAETALAKERGSLIDAGEVEQKWAATAVVVRNGFTNLASQLVPLALGHGMPAEAAAAFGQQVNEAVNGVLRHLSKGDSEETSE
jgi:hypothetical protein